MKIITIGDNVADTYAEEQVYFPGGNCVNVAVDAKKAGATVAAYLGIIGDDDRAEHLIQALKEEGVELFNCRRAYGTTAQPQVFITETGDRRFVSGPQNSVLHQFSLRLTATDLASFADFDVIHIGIDSGIESSLAKLQQCSKVSFDFSDSQDESYIRHTLPYINYAFFSRADLDNREVEQLAAKYLTWGADVVVITRGEKTAFLQSSQTLCYQEPQKIEVVDTMGAGDSFIAGFLVSYLEDKDLQLAAQAASNSAAQTCQLAGGFGHPQTF